MGTASHKFAGSYLSVRTGMSVGEVLDLAEMVASEVHQRRADKPGPVVKLARDESSVEFALVGLRKKPYFRFRVSAVETAEGGAELKSEITYFMTTQSQMLGFIPAGPKQLVGWREYSTFMESLKAAVSDADRSALASITTAEG